MTSPADSPKPPKRLLVVDDDGIFREAIAGLFRQAGWEVVSAPDHNIALSALDGEPISIMVTDLVIPGSVNGIALGRMARMRQRDIKLVYVSGYDIPDAEEILDGKILRKPVEFDELLAAAEKLLLEDGKSA